MNSVNSVHSGEREVKEGFACYAFVWLYLQAPPLINGHVTSSSLNLLKVLSQISPICGGSIRCLVFSLSFTVRGSSSLQTELCIDWCARVKLYLINTAPRAKTCVNECGRSSRKSVPG